jgi:hypothetical protein
LAFDAKFYEETKNLPPQLAECLKKAYERINQIHGGDLPGFELRISDDLSNTQTEQIRVAVEGLMAAYKGRILSTLKSVMELEAEICMLKFQTNLSGNRGG